MRLARLAHSMYFGLTQASCQAHIQDDHDGYLSPVHTQAVCSAGPLVFAVVSPQVPFPAEGPSTLVGPATPDRVQF